MTDHQEQSQGGDVPPKKSKKHHHNNKQKQKHKKQNASEQHQQDHHQQKNHQKNQQKNQQKNNNQDAKSNNKKQSKNGNNNNKNYLKKKRVVEEAIFRSVVNSAYWDPCDRVRLYNEFLTAWYFTTDNCSKHSHNSKRVYTPAMRFNEFVHLALPMIGLNDKWWKQTVREYDNYEINIPRSGFLLINFGLDKMLITHAAKATKDTNWKIPKGKRDEGETRLHCAIRETIEEINIDPTEYILTTNMGEPYSFEVKDYKSELTVFVATGVPDNKKLEVSKNELSAAKWISFSDLFSSNEKCYKFLNNNFKDPLLKMGINRNFLQPTKTSSASSSTKINHDRDNWEVSENVIEQKPFKAN